MTGLLEEAEREMERAERVAANLALIPNFGDRRWATKAEPPELPPEIEAEDAEIHAAEIAQIGTPYVIPPRDALRIDPDELDTARIAPQCIVENLHYADVAALAAPGGTGKTTVVLFEAVHIVLGIPLYGLKVITPGAVLLVTAEDRRELLIARLSRIMGGMELSPEDRAKVCAGVMIWDVSGTVCRLAELDDRGNVMLTDLADAIASHFQDAPPVMVCFDPCISFGAGERLVNDNEQALILAARRIVRGLGCCVRLICHTGKANAREGSIDQYSSRGGSALADGARMVVVLRSWPQGEADALIPPLGFSLRAGEHAIVVVRAKLSYAPPQPFLWIKRRGYTFESTTAATRDPETEAQGRADQLETYLISKLKDGLRFTKTAIDDMSHDLGFRKRSDVRAALGTLRANGRVVDAPLPDGDRQGGRQTYLHPTAVPTPPTAVPTPPELSAG